MTATNNKVHKFRVEYLVLQLPQPSGPIEFIPLARGGATEHCFRETNVVNAKSKNQ